MTVESLSGGEDWSITCIPDNEELEPSPEELDNLYRTIENGTIPELQWKMLGRKPISPVSKEETKPADNFEKEAADKNNDFDFMDEVVLPQMRVRSQNSTPKGSAKKKTANFADVMDAVHKKRLSRTKDSTS